MNRWIKPFVGISTTALAATHFSCATALGGALRDAAIDGTAGFVEGATAELLDRWFDSGGTDE